MNPANFNIQVFNNIFVDQSGTGDEDYTVQVREAALTGTNLFDHNIYYKTTGTASFDDGVSYPALTMAQWKTQLGLDAQSSEINPALNAQFHLNAGSPAINAGQNAPAAQDYDAQTRTGVLDIGADEYGNGPALVVPPPANVIGTGADGAITAVYDLTTELQITVSPNPSSDFFTVTMPETTVQRLQLLGTDGQLLRSIAGNKINVAQLPAGLYILLVTTHQKEQAIPVVVNR